MKQIPALLIAFGLSSAAMADGLLGANFVITNTFQGAQTDNNELDVAGFGFKNNVFATVGEDVELPSFINIYDVDVSKDMIKFTWVETDFSKTITGPTPEGNHDRNYIIFDLPKGVAIDTIAFDAAASDMLEGSAEPTAAVIGSNRVVMDNAGGVVRGVGYNPAFKLTFK
ncbi:MAG: hypothetical protein AAF429_07300 [Pseudomonadota bacterium]